jgi:hypothetical protein
MRPWGNSKSDFEARMPDDLKDVAELMRNDRAEATNLELDRMKTRAMAQAASSRPKGIALRSRTLAAFLTVALMAGGTGGVIAAGGNGNGNGSSGSGQYKPGCGPKKSGGVNPSGTHTGTKKKGRAACPPSKSNGKKPK